jgi:tetratricopeptide (TPR) repeat protein
MQVLKEQGFEAAVARLREMRADTTGAYRLDERELRFAAHQLVWDEKEREALEFFELLVRIYPASAGLWFDLGNRYFYACEVDRARDCLQKSLDLDPRNAYVEWILSSFDELMEIVKVQVRDKDRYAPGQSTGIQGPFLGEEPPGRTPKVFAPGLLNSTANEFSIAFAPDGKEIYFSRAGVGVLVCRWEKEGWTAPEKIDFLDEPYKIDEPSVAPDGKTIFFNARKDLRQPREIYRARRTASGWGKPEKLFAGMYATATRGGTVYYTATSGRPDYGVIARVRPEGDGYSEPEVPEGGLNTRYPDAHPFIAPDESFILFDSNRAGGNSLFVCFRRADGSWGDAISLNEHIDIPAIAGQCALTPDGKYLFFSLHDDMYWVSAAFIDELRPE